MIQTGPPIEAEHYPTGSEDAIASQTSWLIQLLYWSLLLGAAPVASAFILPARLPDPDTVVSALTEIFPIIIALGVTCYTWLRYAWSKEAQWLVGAMAFLSFTSFAIAHTALRLVADGRGDILLASDWCGALARTVCAVLLIAGVITNRKIAGHWGWFVHVFVVALWLLFIGGVVRGTVYLAEQIPPVLPINHSILKHIVTVGPHSASTAACLLAIVVYMRRCVKWGDRICKVACLWLCATTMGCAIRTISMTPTALVWWQAHLFDIAAAGVAAIGLSIDSAISHGKTTKQLAGLQAMHHISWSLASAANLSAMLSAFVEALRNAAEAKLVALYLLDESEGALRLEAVHGDDDSDLSVGSTYSIEPDTRPGFHSGHTARALRTGEVQVVKDVFSDVEFTPWRIVALHDGWVISAPILLHHNTAIGVLNLYMDQDKRVEQEKIHLLEMMSALVAPAIENRKNHAMQRSEERETISQASVADAA